MKSPFLHNTTAAIVVLLATSALNAQATGPLSSAAQRHRAGSPHHSLFPRLLPNEIYAIDDGTAEDAIFGLGGDLICLNEFAVVPGAETVTSVSIAWGTPNVFDPTLNGLPYLAILWSDPNGDGDPTDAVVLGTAAGRISSAGTDTFIMTNLARTIPTPNFFVGFVVRYAEGQYPAAFDKTNPLPERSYVTGNPYQAADIYDLTDNDPNLPLLPIEDYGLFGNWLIRAEGNSSSPLRLLGAASEVGQGGTPYDLNLPLTGAAAIECRFGLSRELDRTYKWVFTFSEPIVSVDDATVRCGAVQRVEVDARNPYQVNLITSNHHCDQQYVTATLTGIHSATETLASAAATMGILVGDVDGSGTVDRADAERVNSLKGAAASFTNYRADVVTDGTVGPLDVKVVRGHVGNSLPSQ